MLRALYSGVSGLEQHQTAIDVIGNNISNVDTIGYKYSRVNFEDQVSQLQLAASAPGAIGGNRGGVNPQQVGLGTVTSTIDQVMTQGNLQTTGKVTDLALQGDGFFITSDGPNVTYTRAGDFDFDSTGSLVNPANGLKVMGWNPTATPGASGALNYSINHSSPVQPIQIPSGAVIPPQATTTLTMKGNLDDTIPTSMPTPTSTPNYFETSTQVFDSLGNQHFITIKFTHNPAPSPTTGSWTWSVENTDPTMTIAPVASAAGNGNDLSFDQNGLLSMQSPTGGKFDAGGVALSWNLPDGTTTSTTVTPDFGQQGQASGITQFATPATAVVADQDGYTRGELTGITIDKSGTINGVFSNGRQQLLGQVAIATFTNPAGLMKNGESGFITTPNSGDAIIRYAGQAEAGTITSGALESSNVDLSQQFADMIVTERGFQANSKVITTSDEILQTVLQLKQ
ncbi:MAG TPA: flagellar hook protein FlgE [Oscillatoriaceae cyanobacterium]